MKIIDIIILSLCVAGLVFFFFDRLKYRNINAYYDKLERLNELRKKIAAVENDKLNTEKYFNSNDLGVVYDDEDTDNFVICKDKLSSLKKEKTEIERFIKNFRMYNKNLSI
jgi:hypothetical protein